jgi:SAM-dependent methyltransferase
MSEKLEQEVALHYGATGLLERILSGLEAGGVDRADLKLEDLAPVDEFHVGGRAATIHAVAPLNLTSDDHVLDIGCGIGGASRYIAAQFGCSVTGIDLTPDYIETARALAELTGLKDRVAYEVASATDLPFESDSFDAAVTIHVAMNIPDRTKLYAETARVLKPGKLFCVYDVMGHDGDPFAYPVPWADTAETSHLTSVEEMRDLLAAAGFTIEHEEDRHQFALDFFRERIAAAKDGPPPLGLHIVMGEKARPKFENILANIENGTVSPVLMIARLGG